MAVTIKDVARAAGCSIKTVSRVINGEPYVTEEMRARVKTAITNTGFAPNLSARRLVTRRTNLLCVLLQPGIFHLDSAGLGRVLNACYERGYDLFFQPYTPMLETSQDRLFDLVAQKRMDGFISTPPCDTDDFVQDLITTYKTPLVQVDPAQPGAAPQVCSSHTSGAREMASHLLALGHRRIAFLRGPDHLRASQERLEGFRLALSEHGVPLDPSLVERGEFTFEGGAGAARRLFGRRDHPTAIFGGDDMSALGALYALQEMGARVPQQVSVCGYGGLEESGLVFPGLSTVNQPADELLEEAVVYLIRWLDKEADLAPAVSLPAQLVLRGSTAPPPGHAGPST